jgi:hypothetical protein
MCSASYRKKQPEKHFKHRATEQQCKIR